MSNVSLTSGPASASGPSASGPASPRPARFGTQLRTHIRALVTERLRIPAAVIPNVIFPTLVFLFFVLPQASVTSDPVVSVTATTQLATFGVMSALIFGYGIDVAEDRSNPWSSYLHTLPVGPLPGVIARAVTSLLFCALALVPLIVVSAIFTDEAQAFTGGDIPWWRLVAGLATVLVSGLPFLGIGLIIGYLSGPKSAVAVVQVVFFPLAFAGGMMLPPQMFPHWLDTISGFLPSRVARDLSIGATTGGDFPWTVLLLWAAWTVLLFAIVAFLQRRDQGVRFR